MRDIFISESHTLISFPVEGQMTERGNFHTLNVKMYLEIIGQGPELEHCNV